ncbi:acetylornithine deacetylase [Frigidibacter albus]|uniref:Acetylornithine deacetylase n=2 Tax=Frigidibacter albus TaxID=1465486 RepID=A0A6L8VLJ7_9RHOB|nr:acetylornithine deacetylase [Frigidibacter albus]MZQ90924.1 acetylornithine deacetylase [Frigidibacter albus]NBE32809.1 acetylornithine deacetylase [Frigidibacter albus]GGH61936.1 acetylornithine deacetylase [Frigidibacter albus]
MTPEAIPEAILADLVACADLPGAPNARVAGCVQAHLARAGVECTVLPGPEGDRVNLFATIGPRDVPGYVLSGHMDVVPVAGQVWASDPFRLRAEGGRLYGRGATDMKGFLACMIAMVPELLALGLRRPIHLAFSYDEEIGCRGVPHMLAALPGLCAPPLACIVGEPTDMQPVLSHKGKQALELVIEGKAAHSSQPDLGVNAIYPAAEVLLFIRNLAARLAAEGPFDARFSPPCSTVVAGVVQGGAALNIIPDRCTVQMEVRSVPGQAPEAISAEVLARLAALEGVRVSHRELARYPALPPPEDRGLAELLERLTGKPALQSVSYGTEAGLFHGAGVPSIICGPGSISRAHRPDEFVTVDELAGCCAMLRGLGQVAAG